MPLGECFEKRGKGMRFLYYVNLIKHDYESRYFSKINFFKFIKAYTLDINFRVVVRYRIQSHLYGGNKLSGILAIIIRNGNIKKYSVELGLNSKIGEGFNIHHINGIVIGDNVVIGKGFSVFQQVTVGKKNIGYPTIGDNVTVYPGAKVIGDIFIGDNVVIGANSVVNKNIDQGKSVAGVPAIEIIKKKSLKRV